MKVRERRGEFVYTIQDQIDFSSIVGLLLAAPGSETRQLLVAAVSVVSLYTSVMLVLMVVELPKLVVFDLIVS